MFIRAHNSLSVGIIIALGITIGLTIGYKQYRCDIVNDKPKQVIEIFTAIGSAIAILFSIIGLVIASKNKDLGIYFWPFFLVLTLSVSGIDFGTYFDKSNCIYSRLSSLVIKGIIIILVVIYMILMYKKQS